jgi:MFS family permease
LPLEAGAYLSVYFAGNFLGLFVATPVLRTFGFRKVLLANPVLVGASIAGLFLLRPGFPKGLAWGMLFVGGIVRSVQFTGQSSLAYAEVPQALDADASTLASVLLQVSASLSVVFATAVLNGVQRITGERHLGPSTFRGTFLLMAALPLLTGWLFRRLPSDAGQALVSTRGRRAIPVDGDAEAAETQSSHRRASRRASVAQAADVVKGC